MSSQMNTKLRLVRCPRCRLVLPELPDIPVYECGGCGTVLQAKHKKTEKKDTVLHQDATDEKGKMVTDCVLEQKKISCSNQATVPCRGESSAEASTSRGVDNFRDCNIKQPGDDGFSDELHISSEFSRHENGALSPKHGERDEMKRDKDIGILDQDQDGKHEFGDSCSELGGDRSSSDDFPSSAELACHETEDSSPDLLARLSLDTDSYSSDHCFRMDKIAHGDCKVENNIGSNFVTKVSKTQDQQQENDLSPKFGKLGEGGKTINLSQQDCTSAERNFPENADCCGESSSFTKTTCNEHEEPIAVVEAKKEFDEDRNDHTAESLNTENAFDKNATGSIDAAENPLNGMDLPNNIIPQGFGHESSPDSLDPSPGVGVKHTDTLKSSMARNYYAYDGSVSSSDGNEDQSPGRFSKPSRRKFKHSAFTNSNGLSRQDESKVKDSLKNKSEMRYQGVIGSGQHDMISSKSEIRQQTRKSSLILEENNRHAMNYRENNQGDLPEPRSYGHPGGSRVRLDNEDYASNFPFMPRYFSGVQRNVPLSSYQHNLFQDIPSYKEPDKKELLRMIYELKEEISRTSISKSRYSAGFSGEQVHPPLFYNHLAPPEDICADLQYSRYPERCSQPTRLSQMQKVPRMAFSGEAAVYRDRVDCSCLHSCPQNRHCSAQLPSHVMCCNKVHHVDLNGHACYKGSGSASSSPKHYTCSRFSLYGRETKSDDQKLRDTKMKRHSREKHYSSKRHIMPVAGGIPIVACYHCSELLHLPADFLLFGRRFHRLRCNACRKVMKFSLDSGTHLSPDVYDAMAPPPSMADECDGSIQQRDLVFASHFDKGPHAEPFSCSDDYGQSFDRSGSTEGESPLMMPSIKPLESDTQNRKTFSGNGNSFQPSEDRKMKSIMVESQKTLKNSKEIIGSKGPSSKMSKWGKSSSEIQELPPSGSPLHRLMGYLSASEVIKP